MLTNQEIWLRVMEALIHRSATRPLNDELPALAAIADGVVRLSVERHGELKTK